MKSSILYFTTSMMPLSETVNFNTNLNKLDITPYKVMGQIPKKGTFKKYSLYQAMRRGRRFFVKTANIRDTKNLVTLLREITMYEVLKKASTKYRSKDLSIPRYEASINRNGLHSLIIEEVDGSSILKKKISERIEIYSKSIEFVRALGGKVSPSDRKLIGKRTVLQEVLMYPLLFTVAAVRHPEYMKILFKGAWYFIFNFTRILKRPKYVLTHRDLHGENIIVSDKKAYIIDWENAIYSDSYMEYVVILLAMWNSKTSRKYFWSLIENKKRGAVFVVKMATHFLTEKEMPKWKKKEYLDAINWAIKI